jgi:hypothetical protein
MNEQPVRRSTSASPVIFSLWLCLAACTRSEASNAHPEPSASSTPVVAAPSAGLLRDRGAADAGSPRAEAVPSVSASSAPVASASGASKAGSEAPGPKLELLDPGREPRSALRYKFKSGVTERVKLINGTTLALEVSGQKVPSAQMPDVELVAALKVLGVDPDGKARRELNVERVGLAETGTLDPSLREQLTGALDLIKELKARDQIDARGRLEVVKLSAGKKSNAMLAQLLEQMQQSFAQMGAPFPEEPIGIGARWTVSTLILQQGMRVNQVATYELTELGAGKGKTHIKLTQLAPRGPVKPPGLPMDVRAELLGMSAKGAGDMSFDLTRSVPEGEIKTHAKLSVRTMLGAEKQDTKMELDVRVRFVREP